MAVKDRKKEEYIETKLPVVAKPQVAQASPPVKERKKEERIETRLPVKAKQQIELAAAMQGRSVSDFVVQAALDQANKVIEQNRIVRLTVDESTALACLMMAEPVVNEKAIAAARRHKELLGQ